MIDNIRRKTIPSKWYMDEQILKIEKRNIFSKSWHLFCSTDQISNPGDYKTMMINDQPIIIIKDENNSINAFYNVCQHRGCVLLDNDGNAKSLKCGYHGWVYDLNGNLKTARGFNKQKIKIEDFSLKPVEHYVWMNLIFVKLQNEYYDIKKTLTKIEKIISPIRFDQYSYHSRVSYKINCNWKIYMDNYLEGFHIPIVHPKLNDAINYKSYKTETFENFSLQWCHIKSQSSPYKKSISNQKAFYFTLFPNILLNIAPGRLQTNIIEPIDALSCNVHFDYYFLDIEPNQISKDINFSEKIQNEDIDICERIQAGLESNGFDSGILSTEYEIGVSHFQNFIENKINNG